MPVRKLLDRFANFANRCWYFASAKRIVPIQVEVQPAAVDEPLMPLMASATPLLPPASPRDEVPAEFRRCCRIMLVLTPLSP
jgi:hypothetical protein